MEKGTVLERAAEWVMYGEVGASSKTIWCVMMGAPKESTLGRYLRHGSTPLDSSDFRRCYLLLTFIPEWRNELYRVADIFPHWKRLVDNWRELEELYEEECEQGRAPKLYQRLTELQG